MPHHVGIDDDGYVRAPADVCYLVLTQVAGWPRFWPGTAVEERGGHEVALRVGRRRRRMRLDGRLRSFRHDVGFVLDLDGDVEGWWEVWLEPGWGGTVVHHVVQAHARAAWAPTVLRRWLRSGLWGLKDHVEGQVLVAGWGPPGRG